MSILESFALTGRVAAVTGANRGLGRAIATGLAEAGADVALVVRDPEAAADQLEELRGLGARAVAVGCDVSDPDHVERAVQQIETGLGPVDAWINNAGITHWGATFDPDLDHDAAWTRILDTNLGSVFHCTRLVGRRMAARGRGAVVNVGSISGLIVNRPQWQAAYNASKAAVHHLTRSTAVELAPSGVRVNAVAPGYIRTDMVSARFEDPEFREHWIERVPMRRAAEPTEVAGAVLFLASDAASFVTGEVLVVDGGYVLT